MKANKNQTDGTVTLQIDSFVKNHLRQWVQAQLPTGEWDKAYDRMLKFACENPDLLDRGWWRIYDLSMESK